VKATFVKFDMNAHSTDAMTKGDGGMAIGSVLELTNGSTKEIVTPVAHYGANGEPTYTPSQSKLVNGNIQLVSMNVGMGKENPSTITVKVQRANASAPAPEALVVEASIKPYINLLWGGTVVMIAGFILAMFKRSKEA
jgi:cytochrome c-type biogenesis protein CcmF